MAPPRRLPQVPCPDPVHAGSQVVSHGTRRVRGGARRDYRCTPRGASKPHKFTLVETTVEVTLPAFSPPPPCVDHPGGRVVRNGTYASSAKARRQRYRCIPADGSRPHQFTPPLPRDHVHTGTDSCSVCEELRGTHRGDPTVARRHSWDARTVAAALNELAVGRSFGEVSRNARRAAGRTRTRRRLDADGQPVRRSRYLGTRLSRNAWHIAADWCETFSPVLWEPLEARLRDSEARRRAALDTLIASGGTVDAPMTVLIDDIPVNARSVGTAGQNQSRRDWFVLAVAEVIWMPSFDPDGVPERDIRLRLLRAMPTNDHYAWKLVFAELGYNPDFIVADAGKGLMKAVPEFFPATTVLVPSLFHVRAAVEEGLLATPGAWTRESKQAPKELRDEFAEHLALLRRSRLHRATPEQWRAWWDELEAKLRALRLPVEPTRRRRTNYERLIVQLLPALAAWPQLPLSTGGLEVKLRQKVDPLLAGRAHAFANLERTNRLFDLAVCRDHGIFDDVSAVARTLRDDSTPNFGWATPLRMVTDTQPAGRRYSSLRDQQLIRDLVRKRGLA